MQNPAAPAAMAITQALEAVMRKDRGRLIAALIAQLRDFQLAEDALQEAMVSAHLHWARTGLPHSPQGWLLRVAQRKAIDRLRRAKRDTAQTAAMAVLAEDEAAPEADPDMIPDERLRLIFTCCHPALDAKSRVALTLRTLGGLTTPEIARAFLDAEPTMGQRLSRAKAKILAARIPYCVPGPADWPDRLQSVLAVVYLIFNAGYDAASPRPNGDLATRDLPTRDLCQEAVYLARMLNALRPGDAEVEGCLSLLLLTYARAQARADGRGATVALADQDRALWNLAAIAEGHAVLEAAMARRTPGPYQVKAAIAACHMADPPDWRQIAALYTRLIGWEPTPVVALNLAVAHAETGALAEGLAALTSLAADFADYQPWHAARADLLARAGRVAESQAAYDRAIALAASAADAAFLTSRRDALPRA